MHRGKVDAGVSEFPRDKELSRDHVNRPLEISTACNAVNSHCLQAIKIVHYHANGRFDWLISGHQSVNPSREAISILSGKYNGFTFVHPVSNSI